MVDRVFLTSYLRLFLMRRNDALKRMAETDEWRRYLG